MAPRPRERAPPSLDAASTHTPHSKSKSLDVSPQQGSHALGRSRESSLRSADASQRRPHPHATRMDALCCNVGPFPRPPEVLRGIPGSACAHEAEAVASAARRVMFADMHSLERFRRQSLAGRVTGQHGPRPVRACGRKRVPHDAGPLTVDLARTRRQRAGSA
jgi:hypothetical protein